MWKWFFEKAMFVLFLVIFFTVNAFSEVEVYSINRTVGWMWDISNSYIFKSAFVYGSWVLFFLGYGITMLLGRRTNLKLSILHTIIFSITLIVGIGGKLFNVEVLVLTGISILVFIVNICQAIINGKLKIIEEN